MEPATLTDVINIARRSCVASCTMLSVIEEYVNPNDVSTIANLTHARNTIMKTLLNNGMTAEEWESFNSAIKQEWQTLLSLEGKYLGGR